MKIFAKDLLPGKKNMPARPAGEKRRAELKRESAVSVSINGLEELFLTTPGISLDSVSRAVAGEACRLTGSRLGFAGYTDPPTGRLIASTPAGNPGKKRSKVWLFASAQFNELWLRVLKENKPLLSNSVSRSRGPAGRPDPGIRIDRFLGLPVLSGRKQLGILALANPRRDYSAAELKTAGELARAYAAMVQHRLADDIKSREHESLVAIIASVQDIVYSADMGGKIIYASPKTAAYGYQPKDLIGRSIFEFVHPQDRGYAEKALVRARETGRTLPMISYRLRKKDGGYFSMEQKSGIIMSGDIPALITGVVRDAGKKTGGAALAKENEATLQNIFETSKDAVFIKDLSGRYIKLNKACADVFLLKPEAALGKTDAELFPPELARALKKDDQEVVSGGKPVVRTYDMVLPSGKYCFNTVKTPLRGSDGKITGVAGVAREITELQKAESERAESSVAAAMNEVAKPLAHELNNALTVINGHAMLINEDVDASGPVKTGIEQIMNAVKWAAELTSRFEYFARNPKPGLRS